MRFIITNCPESMIYNVMYVQYIQYVYICHRLRRTLVRRQNPNLFDSPELTFSNLRRQISAKNGSGAFKTQQKSTEAGKEKGPKSGMITFYIL